MFSSTFGMRAFIRSRHYKQVMKCICSYRCCGQSAVLSGGVIVFPFCWNYFKITVLCLSYVNIMGLLFFFVFLVKFVLSCQACIVWGDGQRTEMWSSKGHGCFLLLKLRGMFFVQRTFWIHKSSGTNGHMPLCDVCGYCVLCVCGLCGNCNKWNPLWMKSCYSWVNPHPTSPNEF